MASRISNESIAAATGRPWDEWMQMIAEAEVGLWSHREIVKFLQTEHEVPSWWAQTLAVEYEKQNDRRQPGETSDAGYEVGVRRTVSIHPREAWEKLFSKEGLDLWLGENTSGFQLREGSGYETGEGATGTVRVVRPNSYIRLTWKPPKWSRATTIQVRINPASQGRTSVGFHQEHLPDPTAREEMRSRWITVLDKLKEAAGD